MSMPLFKKIIEEAATIPQIELLTITGLGETTLDPSLEARIAFARATMPQVPIQIYTHGAHLYPAFYDRLRAAGLGSVVFSLNAVRQEQHERIMGLKGKFDAVCANIEHAIQFHASVPVEIHAVCNHDHFTRDDITAFYDRWGVRGENDFGMVVVEGNWAGGNRLVGRRVGTFQPNMCCDRAISQIYVMYDGRVTTCCFDPTGKQIFGDLNLQSIRELYAGVKYVQFREDHFNDQADKYEICATCTRI